MPQDTGELLVAFRTVYQQFEQAVKEVLLDLADPTVIAQLGDGLDEYATLAIDNGSIFEPDELDRLRVNLRLMQADIRLRYEEMLDASHHGRPTIVQTIRTGNRGRPRIQIDPTFLRWAYSQRTTSGICRFIHPLSLLLAALVMDGSYAGGTLSLNSDNAGVNGTTVVYSDNNWNTATVDNNDTTSISCTTVLIPPHQTPRDYKFDLFFDLRLHSNYLAQRSGVSSVLIESLLAVLHSRILVANRSILSRELVSVVAGRAQNVEVATTRVPHFSDNMHEPLNGYRSLGTLSGINEQLIPPPAYIDSDREVLAIEPDSSKTAKYAKVWGPHGLNPHTHFIVIFKHLPITPSSSIHSSRHGSPSPFTISGPNFWASASRNVCSPLSPIVFHTPSPIDSSGTSSRASSVAYQAPSSLRNSNAPSPNTGLAPLGVNETINPPLGSTGPENVPFDVRACDVTPDTAYLRHSSSVGSQNAPYDTRTGDGALDGAYQQHSDENALAADTPIRDASVNAVCRHFGIADEMMAAAKYQEKSKSLLAMVLNHRAMASILVTLQFCGEDAPLAKGKVVKFNDGLQLSATNVLRAYDWSWDSYKHKTKWYSWAENAARSLEWDATRPPGNDTSLYKIWLGIKYFWGPSGPLCRSDWSERTFDDPEAQTTQQAARSLSQTQISANKAVISSYLVQRHVT